ncbi:hypothetical protein Dsin_024446 [Dipteronia sinensis]|uniref:Uncharacterized protein n=1 Tax=Dipteronia sinensis TaxID=43782 RepID=A0AAD9ZU76_9ROSI|nr:hypothetical protein Dsin_024446 [Dipteronia sinensis]
MQQIFLPQLPVSPGDVLQVNFKPQRFLYTITADTVSKNYFHNLLFSQLILSNPEVHANSPNSGGGGFPTLLLTVLQVIDHTSYAVSNTDGDQTVIASDDFIKSDVILGSKQIEATHPCMDYILGASEHLQCKNDLRHDNNVKRLASYVVLKSSHSSANPQSKLSSPPSLTGSAISTARNNAQIEMTGSLSMYSNQCVVVGS